MKKETLNMIGLAKRAGGVMSGSYLVEQALHKRKAKLVLIAEDASDNTKKQIYNQCQYRGVPAVIIGLKAELGHALGQAERSCLAVCDDNLASAVNRKLSEEEGMKRDLQGV